MRIYECRLRDIEVRLNDGDSLPEALQNCPDHNLPLRERTHPTGECREYYTLNGVDPVWHCSHEPGAKAYEPAGVK